MQIHVPLRSQEGLATCQSPAETFEFWNRELHNLSTLSTVCDPTGEDFPLLIEEMDKVWGFTSVTGKLFGFKTPTPQMHRADRISQAWANCVRNAELASNDTGMAVTPTEWFKAQI